MSNQQRVRSITSSTLDDNIKRFLSSQSYTHLWQGPIWYDQRQNTNTDMSAFVGLKNGGEIVSFAQVLYIPFMRNKLFAYVSGGPVWSAGDHEALKEILQRIIREARTRKCIFVKLDPTVAALTDKEKKVLDTFGAVPQAYEVRPTGTALIDLKKQKDLLASFQKKTRYCIRQALKYDLSFDQATSQKDYAVYEQLIAKTEKRQGFKHRDSQFFLNFLETFKFGDPFYLFLAKKDQTPLAGGIFVRYQKRLHYLSGGFDYEYQRYQGSSFLQYKVMEFANEQGDRYYDFFSYSTKENKQFYLVDKFKRNFNPDIVEWVDGMDVPLNKIYYSIYRLRHRISRI